MTTLSTAHFGISLEKGNFLKLIIGQHGEKWLGNLFRKPVPVQKRDPKKDYLHKKQKMRTVPLDVAPERCTKRCSKTPKLQTV